MKQQPPCIIMNRTVTAVHIPPGTRTFKRHTCFRPKSVKWDSSLDPCIRFSVFHVVVPCRTKTICLSTSSGSRSFGTSERDEPAVPKRPPVTNGERGYALLTGPSCSCAEHVVAFRLKLFSLPDCCTHLRGGHFIDTALIAMPKHVTTKPV